MPKMRIGIVHNKVSKFISKPPAKRAARKAKTITVTKGTQTKTIVKKAKVPAPMASPNTSLVKPAVPQTKAAKMGAAPKMTPTTPSFSVANRVAPAKRAVKKPRTMTITKGTQSKTITRRR